MSSTRTAARPFSSNSASPASSRLCTVWRPCARSSRSCAGLPPPSDGRRGLLPLVIARVAGGGGTPTGWLAASPGFAPGQASRLTIDQGNVQTGSLVGLTQQWRAARWVLAACRPGAVKGEWGGGRGPGGFQGGRSPRPARVLYVNLGHAPFSHDDAPVIVDSDMGRLRWRRTPHPVAASSPAW